ncbi:hypothetical protein KY285_000851 [Solanum tuberosum]|nr:hypothetical protein KY285_000851 [Solanum tuberosum]
MKELEATLHNVAVNSETLNQLNWGAKGDGKFSVIAAFKLLGPQNAITTTGLGSLYGRSSCPRRLVASAGLHFMELA